MQAAESNWTDALIEEDFRIRDALECLTQTGLMIACVVDKNRLLIGVITDSDIRRALLSGLGVDDSINPIINRTPIVANIDDNETELAKIFYDNGIRQVPLIDQQNRVRGIYVHAKSRLDSFKSSSQINLAQPTKPNAAFILAGGQGKRLRKVVSDIPKPLAVVGGKPILQTLIERLAASGIQELHVSTNYMARKIEEHLQHPCYQDLHISIVREEKYLGTAGSLGLLKHLPQQPMLVCNADVLTTVPYDEILHHHEDHKADLSVVVRPYEIEVPYGVLKLDNSNRIDSVIEKPKSRYLVNAGIYVVSPSVVANVAKNQYLDMPDLVNSLLNSNKKVVPFYLHEYWVDIGKPDDFHRANQEYDLYFSGEPTRL